MKDNYYYRLNQSHKNLDNKDYIKTTTKIMNDVLIDQANKDSLLVIGAGNMSDFDLEFFLSKFRNICLSDIDLVSLKQALGKKLNHPKITVMKIDYLGIEETHFYDDFETLLKMTDYHDVEHFFEWKMTQLKSYHFSNKFSQQFDSIYISPIYTQLFYREVEVKLTSLVKKGFSNMFKQNILLVLFQSMIDIIDLFNNEIVKLLTENGIVFAGSDIFLLKQDTFSKKVKSNIDKNESMKEIYRKYNDEYGFGLGDYGLNSLSQKLNLINEKWSLWGKENHNAYAVKFEVMKKE